jgi:type II secretory pathway component PulK
MPAGRAYNCRRSLPYAGQRGMVLVLAVFAVALVLVLAVGLTSVVRSELLASRANLERAQSLFLAQAGISQARALLLYEDPNTDSQVDPWGVEADDSPDLPHAFGAGYVRVRVSDASGRININTADYNTLLQLTGDAALTASIIDWRGRGSEADYYSTLPVSYTPRKGAFQSPGELLLVQGMTPDLYFGTKDRVGLVDLITVQSEAPDTDASGQDRIYLNSFGAWENTSFQQWVAARVGDVLSMYEMELIWRGYASLAESGGYTSLAQLGTVAGLPYDKLIKVVDSFTARNPSAGAATGRVNVNTASVEVLAVLPGCNQQLAEAIVKQRGQQPFLSLNEIASFIYSSGGGAEAFERMIDRITTKSSTFIVEAMGYTEAGHGFRTLRALMRRTKDQVRVLQQVEEDAPLPPPVLEEMTMQADSRRSTLAPS